ncbi:MAG TPA: helix-turn-helix domain-containing protein [Acidimicrobiales bacterium]|nr:helix-turn-helix domain-containing protein [Acidimicrobiales bacterium]
MDAASDEWQRQARALGEPTRYRLFRYIAEAHQPVAVLELTSFARLNHNAVRQHLAVLRDAGLVLEELERRNRPGRPRLLYRLHPEAAGRFGTPGAYVWLATLLSEAVRRREGARAAGRREGLRRARALGPSEDPARLFEEEMVSRGFRPLRRDRGQLVEFVLGRCPFAAVAEGDPETVCQLHLGLAEGLAEGLGRLRMERLTTRDARRAGCRVVVRRAGAEDLEPARGTSGRA